MRKILIVLILATIAIMLFVSVAHGDITSNLVVHLKLNDGAGTTASDSTPENNDGLLTGCSWITTAKYSGGLLFEAASNDFVDVGDDASIRLVNEVTYSCWVKTEGTADLMDRWEGGKEATMLRIEGAGTVGFYINTAGGTKSVTSAGVVDDNVWHHVVGVYDGTTLKVYVDGDLDCTPTNYDGTIVVSDSDLRLGYGWSAAYLDGSMDEVRVYSRALGSGEVADLYNYTEETVAEAITSLNWMAFIVLLVFTLLNIALMFVPRIFILNFVVAVLTLGFAASTVNDATLPIQPYFSLIVSLVAVLGMLRVGNIMRNQ